eukprot:CAMPEP_0119150820 /NCGR_PEP_ID=MMETSP1310-20130426/45420_1 /TAXON_ID=464262 /ORGANISM="Genus nov. species nov., Strain RCC2339" /LENGTH=534 /DNA_ID=CAMNT_0007143045 /DNA_START=40 /DNA_END=1641 /DNA_ORIENTATION=+
MTTARSFQPIQLGGKAGSTAPGILKISEFGLGWKSSASGQKLGVEKQELKKAYWVNSGDSFQLRVEIKGGAMYKFDGFQDEDYDALKEFFANVFKIPFSEVELSNKGWNWGDLDLQRASLCYKVDRKEAFDVPMSDIAQCTANRHEVAVQFHQYDNITTDDNDILMEMRLFVSPTNQELQGLNPAGKSAADNLKDLVVKKADINAGVGQGLLMLEQVPCLAPRGRYNVEFSTKFLKMYGGTNQFKIQYSNITRLFNLPRPDGRHNDVVVSVSPPLRSGHTPYSNIVFHFPHDSETEAKINMSEEELLEKYDGKLEKEFKEPTHRLVSRMFKVLTNQSIVVPGRFESANNEKCIRCSLKANDGLLYPLEKGFVFLHKPATYIAYRDIEKLGFDRAETAAVSTRNFDIEVFLKSGGTQKFQNIHKPEYSKIFNFLSAKNIRIEGARVSGDFSSRSRVSEAELQEVLGDDDDSDSDDEDFGEGDMQEDDSDDYGSELERSISDFSGDEGTSKKRKKKSSKSKGDDEGTPKKKKSKKK